MKKILCIMFVITMIFTMTACDGDTDISGDSEVPVQNGEEQDQQSTAEENGENLDWALDYFNKDISILLADKKTGDYYEDEYYKWVSYDFEDYNITFHTVENYVISEHPVDCEKAGLNKGMITSISLSISNDLYDDVNETIIGYPDVTIGGVNFGMDIIENDNGIKETEEYYIEYFDNSYYSPNKVTSIYIKSMLEDDVLKGRYAPEFTIEPLDSNTPVKKINVGMTKEEVIGILGNDFEEENYIDEMYGDEYNQLVYDDVVIDIYKGTDGYQGSQELLDKVNSISIYTNKVTGNFDICVGDSALDVLQFCDENYEHVINRHAVEYEPLFGMYKIGQKNDIDIVVSFIFDNYGNINSVEDIKKDTVVQEIDIFYFYSMN